MAVWILQVVWKSDFSVQKNINLNGTWSTWSTIISKIFISPEEQKVLDQAEADKKRIAQIRADEDSKTNILILGRWWWRHDAPELTDSIILASFHRNKNHISLLSIPRDLFVEYDDYMQSWKPYTGKINGLYVHYLWKKYSKEKAVKQLQKKITEITGEKIDHYVNIDFYWFVQLIDSLWWVQIKVPKTIVDHQYPNSTLGYQTFMLRKWDWLLDWKVALKYVRSRKNTGWDFWRSERQQQVIESLKAKILNWKYLANPANIKDLYDIFTEYVITDINLVTAIKLFTDIKTKENTKVYSSWINDTCIKAHECMKGWLVYYPQRIHFWGQSVLLPDWASYDELDYFDTIKQYSNIVFNLPESFDEKYKISIFSKKEDKEYAYKLAQKIKILWWEINLIEKIWEIPKPPINKWDDDNDSLNKLSTKKKLNLEEYNKLKQEWKIDEIVSKSGSTITKEKPLISSEYDIVKTKIIINWIDTENKTIWILQLLTWVQENEIEIYNWWPKYARDPEKKIEILFTR